MNIVNKSQDSVLVDFSIFSSRYRKMAITPTSSVKMPNQTSYLVEYSTSRSRTSRISQFLILVIVSTELKTVRPSLLAVKYYNIAWLFFISPGLAIIESSRILKSGPCRPFKESLFSQQISQKFGVETMIGAIIPRIINHTVDFKGLLAVLARSSASGHRKAVLATPKAVQLSQFSRRKKQKYSSVSSTRPSGQELIPEIHVRAGVHCRSTSWRGLTPLRYSTSKYNDFSGLLPKSRDQV